MAESKSEITTGEHPSVMSEYELTFLAAKIVAWQLP